MNMFKKNGGFTLVELIVVIAILAILAAIAVPAYSGYIEKANDAADTVALSAIKTAAMGAYATEGAVTEIKVTAADGVISKIEVRVDDAVTEAEEGAEATPAYQTVYTGAQGEGETATEAEFNNEDFGMFMNEEMPELKGSHKDGTTWYAADQVDASGKVTTPAGWNADEADDE